MKYTFIVREEVVRSLVVTVEADDVIAARDAAYEAADKEPAAAWVYNVKDVKAENVDA